MSDPQPTPAVLPSHTGELAQTFMPVQREAAAHIYAIVTGLAAAFNVLVIMVISLVLMPKVDQTNLKLEHNRAIAEDIRDLSRANHEQLKANWRELEEHRLVIKRLSTALDAAEARAKALEKTRKPPPKP